jgi:pimeloyl-ACP methyl ester carboxylesterase
MLHRTVNGWNMPYVEVGRGPTLVCIHGSLGDYRVWSAVMGPLSLRRRIVAPSLRHFFPARAIEPHGPFTMAQHVADTIAFIESLGAPIDLLGHSRGGHIAFRVAQQRPDLVRRLVLAEPGGSLDESLASGVSARSHIADTARLIAAGDAEGGVRHFVDAVDGPGGWQRMAETSRQLLRDNAHTMAVQPNEQRQPFTRADAAAIAVPTLFVGGADTPGLLAAIHRALASHVRNAQTALIPGARHWMFDQDPRRFCEVVLRFLDEA